MTRAKQQLLGIAAPKITAAELRFQRETLRRGGPYEVQGRKWSKKKLNQVWDLGKFHAEVAAMLPTLKKMR